MFRSKGTVRALSVLYKVLWIFCLLLALFFAFFIYFCLCVEPTAPELSIFGFVVVAVGVGGMVVSFREDRLLRRMKGLQIILSPVADTPVAVIAREWGVSEEKAESMLKKMIQRGHLRQVRMDLVNHLVVPIYKPRRQEPVVKLPVMVEVKCEQCGGTTTIEKGKTGRCAYCDSAIEGK